MQLEYATFRTRSGFRYIQMGNPGWYQVIFQRDLAFTYTNPPAFGTTECGTSQKMFYSKRRCRGFSVAQLKTSKG